MLGLRQGSPLYISRDRPWYTGAPLGGVCLWGWGNPRFPLPPPPLPQAFHVLWPPFCLVSNSYFYSRRFSVNSHHWGMGQQEEQEGLKEQTEGWQGAVPLDRQAAPSPQALLPSARSPSINAKDRTTMVTRPHSVF